MSSVPRQALPGLVLVLALLGCDSGERHSAGIAYENVSLHDNCQSFLDASYLTKGYYYTLA